MELNKAAVLRNRRSRKLIVERTFQYRFAILLSLIGGGIFALFSGLLLYFLRLNYETFIQEAVIQFPDVVVSLKREFRMLSLFIVGSLVVMVGALFVLGLALSQRVAGPIYALKRQLLNLGNNRKNIRLNLRTADEFRNLEEVFNWAMETVEKRNLDELEKLELVLKLVEENRSDFAGKELRLLLGR